ncbi:MAG: sulfatase [Planctomycetota bacterium]
MSTLSKPNIVLITLHDTGRHFGCYGVPSVVSPHIDQLAAEGVRFSSHFATAPVCSASRGALTTGRYPQRNGLMGLTHSPWLWEMNPGEQHISHLLRSAGYETILGRFQHETEDVSTLGFDRHLVMEEIGAHRAAPAITEYIRARGRGDRPMYLQLGFFETHTPYDYDGCAPDDERGVWVPPWVVENDGARAHFAGLQGMVRRVDEAIGATLEAIRDIGLEDDTLIVFTVDHGVEVGGRAAKWSLYDAGLETALVMRWPGGGIDGGRTCDALLSNVDVLPTILELSGVDSPTEFDGMSFSAQARGVSNDEVRESLFAIWVHDGMRCVRTPRYKLIRNFAPKRRRAVPVDLSSGRWATMEQLPFVELYNLETDPHELVDLAPDPEWASVGAALDAKLLDHLRALDDPILRGPVHMPYYDLAMESVAAPWPRT